MSDDPTTVFRPESLRRYQQGRESAPAAVHDGSDGPFALAWFAVAVLSSAGLLIGAGPGTIVGAPSGMFRGGGVPVAMSGAVVACLLATAGLLTVVNRRLGRRRVPVLLQMTAVECGAACLAMVLSYFGRATRVVECAEQLGVGRDGSTACAIAEGARSFGLHVRAYSLPPNGLARVALPAIVHWEFNHFLVLERWNRARVEVIDPGCGRRRLTADEFDRGFTGVTLVCEPADGFEHRAGERVRWLRAVRAFGIRHPRLLIQVMLASALLELLGLALPVLSKVVVDQVLPTRATDMLGILAIGIGILVATQFVLSFLRASLLVALRVRLEAHLVPTLVDRLLGLPYRFFEQRRSGDLIARIASVSLMRETLTGQAVSTVLDGSLAVTYLILVLTLDVALGAAVLGLVSAQAVLVSATARTRRDLERRELAADAAAQSYLVEALSGIATLKASGTEERARQRWHSLFTEQVAAAAHNGRQAASIESGLSGLRVLAPLALLLVGATQVLDGHMPLGTMLASTALASAALTPLGSLIDSGERLQLVSAHVERLADIALAQPESASAGKAPAPALRGSIEMANLSFRYDTHSPLAIHDVSIRIQAGQKVAVVGRSGSGKSTLGKLLLALYEPTEGTILYDDIPAARLERQSLRRQFGVVLQEPVLFSGSIRDNIAFSAPAASLAAVADAAALVGIKEEIERMPMAYETPLAEGGMGLSGGQRQRLALARALLHRPAILLLDEATSHLDVLSEAAVECNLSALGCTRIIIAHRLSTVRDADLILVMEEGRIVERGDHDELSARGGAYAALVTTQAQLEPPQPPAQPAARRSARRRSARP